MTIVRAVYNAPCQMLLARLHSGKIALVYLDPPWTIHPPAWTYQDAATQDPLDLYLDLLSEVLLQSHRVLADDGTLFLHAEPQIASYVQVVLDRVFGERSFRSEFIVPRRRSYASRGPGIGHDSILMYSKSEDYVYNPPLRPIGAAQVEERYRYSDDRGRYYLRTLFGPRRSPSQVYEWQGILPPEGKEWTVSKDALQQLQDKGQVASGLSEKLPSLKVYLDEHPMVEVGTVWDDISPDPSSEEREPFPSQQPVALLDRVVRMSSDPGDLVLDPFCGSGTALLAAQRADRQWIGCDVSEQAYSIALARLQRICDLTPGSDFETGDHSIIEARYPDPHPVMQNADFGVVLVRSGPEMQVESVEGLDSFGPQRTSVPYIITEGRTDWKHLKAAYLRLVEAGHLDLDVEFHEFEEEGMGDAELLKMCQAFARKRQDQPVVCIFDRDTPSTVKKVTDKGADYKVWGNGVFSIALPVPEHRARDQGICIELYYRDEDMKRKDSQGRRLYTSDEFDNRSGRHVRENVNCPVLNRVRRRLAIIDDRVFDKDNRNVALSKNSYADYVLNRHHAFGDLDISEFEKLFQLIARIAQPER